MKTILLVGAVLCLGFGFGPLAHADTEPRLSQFSGKLVPRFDSLRYSTVNGRAGPSLDYPIEWTYERAGLPVLILKESPDWRWVRDPEGTEVWVHARMLSGKPAAMVRQETILKTSATPEADPVAILQAGAIVTVAELSQGWARVEAGGYSGWVATADIWGAAPGSD